MCRHEYCHQSKSSSSQLRAPLAERHQLLHEDDERDKHHPEKTHGAGDHQDGHEAPAAADTVSAVLHPQSESVKCARTTPVVHQKVKRRSALAQARLLEWSELVYACDGENTG